MASSCGESSSVSSSEPAVALSRERADKGPLADATGPPRPRLSRNGDRSPFAIEVRVGVRVGVEGGIQDRSHKVSRRG